MLILGLRLEFDAVPDLCDLFQDHLDKIPNAYVAEKLPGYPFFFFWGVFLALYFVCLSKLARRQS